MIDIYPEKAYTTSNPANASNIPSTSILNRVFPGEYTFELRLDEMKCVIALPKPTVKTIPKRPTMAMNNAITPRSLGGKILAANI